MCSQLVIVWCYEGKRKPWYAFDAEVSNYIEQSYCQKSSNKNGISLGQFPSQNNGHIDLDNMTMKNGQKGASSKVMRVEFLSNSLFGNGFKWEVQGDGNSEWIPYDLDTAIKLEKAHLDTSESLQKIKIEVLPYEIDLKKNIQMNMKTRKKRQIRRQRLGQPYVQANPSSAATSNVGGFSASDKMEFLPMQSSVSISEAEFSPKMESIDSFGKFMCPITEDLDKDSCSICFETLSEESSYGEGHPDANEVVKLISCEHLFHKLCLQEMYKCGESDKCLQCPSCKAIYGEKFGNCPPGTMEWEILQRGQIPGYEKYDVIMVIYNIPSGIQGPEHPVPGNWFTAKYFPRRGYIPDCKKGRKVLKLLMEAFRRRLIFTISTSVSTGEDSTVTWNEIHHKTEYSGNTRGHGYPDPNYLDNVTIELASQGVTEDCL